MAEKQRKYIYEYMGFRFEIAMKKKKKKSHRLYRERLFRELLFWPGLSQVFLELFDCLVNGT